MAHLLTDNERAKLRQYRMGEEIEFLGKRLQRRIDYRKQNWTVDPTCSIPRLSDPIKIAVVGLGGAGKSSLCNALVGKEKFVTGKSAASVTEVCRVSALNVDDQDFLILDTPGYMLGKMESFSEKELMKRTQELLTGFKVIGQGVHAIIFAINASSARDRQKEIEVMAKSKMVSVDTASIKHCMLVATHASSNYSNDTVHSFLQNARESEDFKKFVDKISSRVVLVELETQDLQEADIKYSEQERKLTARMVLSMVGKVMQENRSRLLDHSTIENEMKLCFPARAIVSTPSGPKAMEDLLLNDEVVVANQLGQTKYERVIMFSHAARDEVGCFMSISTEDGKVLRLSPGHLVHVGQVGQLKPARDVKAGDVMFTCGEGKQQAGTVRSVKVTEVSNEWFTAGIFCPHTPSGSIIVDGVLASCYTDLMSPTLAHALMFPVRTLHWVLPEDWFVWLVPYNSEQGMPKVLWSMRNAILRQ